MKTEDGNIFDYTQVIEWILYIYVAVPRQDSMSPACMGEWCPVWVLQQICWISLGKQHGRIV